MSESLSGIGNQALEAALGKTSNKAASGAAKASHASKASSGAKANSTPAVDAGPSPASIVSLSGNSAGSGTSQVQDTALYSAVKSTAKVLTADSASSAPAKKNNKVQPGAENGLNAKAIKDEIKAAKLAKAEESQAARAAKAEETKAARAAQAEEAQAAKAAKVEETRAGRAARAEEKQATLAAKAEEAKAARAAKNTDPAIDPNIPSSTALGTLPTDELWRLIQHANEIGKASSFNNALPTAEELAHVQAEIKLAVEREQAEGHPVREYGPGTKPQPVLETEALYQEALKNADEIVRRREAGDWDSLGIAIGEIMQPPASALMVWHAPRPTLDGNSFVTNTTEQLNIGFSGKDNGHSDKVYWSDDNFVTRHLMGTTDHGGGVSLQNVKPGTKFDFGVENEQGQFFRTGLVNPEDVTVKGQVYDPQNHVQTTLSTLTQLRGATIRFGGIDGKDDGQLNDLFITTLSVWWTSPSSFYYLKNPPGSGTDNTPGTGATTPPQNDNHSGLGDGTNPGQGAGQVNSPNQGTDNPGNGSNPPPVSGTDTTSGTGGATPSHDNHSGLGDGTNPGQGDGRTNSPNQGANNPNNAATSTTVNALGEYLDILKL